MPAARILIVEDESITAMYLSKLLDEEGFETVGLEPSGESALEKMEELRPDLVLMDIHLAGELDGIETAARIHDRFAVPVVYVSAYSDEETLRRVKDTQPFGYLIKPVDKGLLRTTIQIALSAHGAVLERTHALNDRDRLLGAFQRITRSMLASLDLDHVLDALAEQIVAAGIFRSLMVALVDEDSRSIRVVRSLTRSRGRQGTTATPFVGQMHALDRVYGLDDDNLTAEVARAGEREVIVGWDERFDADRYGLESYRDKVSYFLPVKHDDRVVAVLATASRISEQQATLDRIRLIEPLLDQVAIALGHAQLHRSVQLRSAEIERINRNLQREITERRRAEESLKQEVLLREAETELRVRVASMQQPHDLFHLVKGISAQLSQLGVAHEHCSLQVANASGDDFISLSEENSSPRSRAWRKISDLSWSRDSTNADDFPWVLEVWRTKAARSEPRNPPGNGLPPGFSVIDVPFSQGTLAISAETSHAFSPRDVDIATRFAEIISAGFQRFDDLFRRG